MNTRRRDPSEHWRRSLASWRARLVRASPLARDFGIILLVKAGVLALLWWVFFSAPLTRHASFDSKTMERQLLAGPHGGGVARAAR